MNDWREAPQAASLLSSTIDSVRIPRTAEAEVVAQGLEPRTSGM
jgi:hypothetical protein